MTRCDMSIPDGSTAFLSSPAQPFRATVKTATTTAWQVSFLGGGVGLPGLVKADAVAYVRCVSGN